PPPRALSATFANGHLQARCRSIDSAAQRGRIDVVAFRFGPEFPDQGRPASHFDRYCSGKLGGAPGRMNAAVRQVVAASLARPRPAEVLALRPAGPPREFTKSFPK